MPAAVTVTFVYHYRKRFLGSTVMRAHQLIEIMRPHLPDRIALTLSAVPRTTLARLAWPYQHAAGTVYFFTKGALKYLKAPLCHAIKRRGGIICVDYVDDPLPDAIVPDADIHVASSYQQLDVLRSILATPATGRPIGGSAMLLLHNSDARLYAFNQALPTDRLRAVYLGRIEETFIEGRIADVVTCLPAKDQATMNASLQSLAGFNFHYCLRAKKNVEGDGLRRYKPLTKVAVAASIGATALADRRAGDAERLLGADYPYLVDTHEEGAIMDAIRGAAEDFGGPRWRLAAERMADVRELISPAALARQFEAILAEAGR